MSKLDDLFTAAQAELGRPYDYGAEGPDSFDCSGLMQYVFAKIGIALPRTAEEQRKATSPVQSPQPGDLVFWGVPAYHVALYIGNGKIIAAPHTGALVQVESLWGSPSQYGRVPGLVSALGGAVSTVADWTTSAGGAVTNWISSTVGAGAQHIVLEFLFLALGAGLLGYGAWRTASPARKSANLEES